MTDFPPWVPIPSHRTGVGDGSANSMLIPEQFGPIAEWINKHIRSWHGPYGYGDWPLYDYYVDDSWAATGFPEGTIINTYTGTKIYSTIQGAVNAWSTSAADKTMFIAPGHYDEDVVVNATSTQHIHMEGGSAARTFIDGSITFNGQFNNNLSVEWRPPSVIRNLKVSAVAGGSAGDLFLGQTTVHTPNTIEGLSFENCHFEGQLKGLYHATSMATLVLRCSFSNCTFGGADDNGGVLILEETSFDRCAFEGPFDLHYGYGGTASSIGEASNSLEPCVFTETLFRQGLIIGDVYAGTFTDCTFQSLTGVDHAMWISGGSDGPGTLYGPNVGECILSGCHFVYYRGANAEFSFIKLGSNQSIGYTSWENFTVTDCTVDVPNAPYAGTNPIHIIWSIGELANGDVPKIVFAHNALIEDSDGNRLEDLTTTPASTTVKGTFRDSVFGPNEPPNCVYDVKGPNNVFYPDSAIPYYSASVGGKHIVYMDGVDTTVVYWKAFACRFDGVTKWVAAGSLGGVAMPGFAPPVYYVIEVTSAGVVQGTSLGLAANKYNACTAGCIPLAVVEANGVLGVGTTFKIDHGRATPLDLDTGLTAGGSAPAPNDAQYVVLAADGDLTVERVFAPGVGLTATDDGAGGDYHLIHATDATAIPNAHHNAVTIGADGEHSLATQVLSGVDAAAAQKGHIQLAGQLGGSAASPTVKGITETSGPTALTVGTITDGQFLKRVAGTLVSAAVSGDVATDTIWAAAGDLVVGTGVDTAGILSKGTDGKVLTMVAGAVAWAAPAAGGGDVATDAIWDAKGDLAGGTGANTAAKLTVGANDTMLMAASGEATGLKWANKATVLAAIDREDADINTLADTVADGLIATHAADDDAHHAVFTSAQHTAIGDGAPHHAKYTDAEAVAAVSAKVSMTIYQDLDLGANDERQGYMYLFGDGAGSSSGGQIYFYTAADYDDAFGYYLLGTYQDDFRLSTNLTGTFLTVKNDKSIEIPTGPLKVDHLNEYTANHGVNIEGVSLLDSFADLTEIAKPANPAANALRVYAKDDGAGVTKLYGLDSAGTETAYGAGGGGGDVATDAIWDAAGDLAVGTGANTAAKLALTVPGGANLLNVLGVVNGETTPTWKALFDTTHPENLGTAAEGSGTIAALRNHVHTLPKLDDLAAPDANTDLDASTTAHGLVVAATAPAAGLYNYVGITNAETAYTNKALFDATVPTTIAPSDAATAGTAAVAARRDHLHAAPATFPATAHALFSTTHSDIAAAAAPVDGDMIIGNATPKWSKLAISIPGGAGLLNVMGIVTGELRSSWKALFDATAPAAIGTAAAGTATTAAHRDHVHAADSDDVTYAPTTAADWDGAADPGDVEQALDQLAERVRNASVWVPASAMWPSTSTGAAWPARREYTTNDVDVFYVAFDSGAVVNDEKAQFSVVLPVWDQGTVTLTYHWTTVAAAGTTVCWSADAVSIANDGALDSAWGSAVTATDTVLAAGDVHIITSGAITVSGAGAGEFVNFRIMRDTSEDDCASDADLLGVVINYNKRDA